MKYVNFVRGRYAVRVTVPDELRGILGKRELVEPLGADKKTAERTAHGVIAGFLAQIEDAKERLESSKPTLSSAVKAHYQAELETDDRERLELGETIMVESGSTLPGYAQYLRLVAAGEITGDDAEVLIGHAADKLAGKGFLLDMSRGELLRALAHVELDVIAVVDARNNNVVATPEPRSTLLTMPEPEGIARLKSIARRA